MDGWRDGCTWKAAGKGRSKKLQARLARQGSSVSSQPRLSDPCDLALARWATSGLFQLKPATPAWTALAVLPMPAHVPLVPTYSGTAVPRWVGAHCQGTSVAVFVWLAVRRVGRSLTCANSLGHRWVPIQLTLSCLSPEVSNGFLLLDDLPPRQPPPPFPFPCWCCLLPGRRPSSVSPVVVGNKCSRAVQVRSHLEGDDRRSH